MDTEAPPVERGAIRVCPLDGEPVVFTFEYPGHEYVCVVCGWKGGVLGHHDRRATAALIARATELSDRYEAERAEREGRPPPVPSQDEGTPPTCAGCGAVGSGRLVGGKPPHWYSRTPIATGVTEYACSRVCIPSGTGLVLPW